MLICEKRSFNHAEKDICVLFVQDYQNTPMISQTCENFPVFLKLVIGAKDQLLDFYHNKSQ